MGRVCKRWGLGWDIEGWKNDGPRIGLGREAVRKAERWGLWPWASHQSWEWERKNRLKLRMPSTGPQVKIPTFNG